MHTSEHVLFPCDLGFRMPAEWALHQATWTSWPVGLENWGESLADVRKEFAALVNLIAKYEPVHLLVSDEECEKSARSAGLSASVTLHRVPLNDIWMRDNGPIFIKKGNEVNFVNWQFNAWGEKYEWDKDNEVPHYVERFLKMRTFSSPMILEGGSLDVNGLGLALTTRQCLLSPMRNPSFSVPDIERELKKHLGIDQVIWLNNGLEGDHTDGHIDTITRFVDEHTVVSSVSDDPQDPNFATMQENIAILQKYNRENPQNQLKIIELPLPKERRYLGENRLPATYANFYIGNGFVVVPCYGDPHDERALEVLRPLFPNREVIGISSKVLIQGGGSFHCVTQQQPA